MISNPLLVYPIMGCVALVVFVGWLGYRIAHLAEQSRHLAARVGQLEARSSAKPIAAPRDWADELPPTAVRSPTLIAVPDLAVGSPARSASAELDRRHGVVWALADLGHSAEAIAGQTGQPVGQVELILGLRRQLLAAGTAPDD